MKDPKMKIHLEVQIGFYGTPKIACGKKGVKNVAPCDISKVTCNDCLEWYKKHKTDKDHDVSCHNNQHSAHYDGPHGWG